MGFEVNNFIVNIFDLILIVIIGLIFLLMLHIILKYMKNGESKRRKKL